MNNPYTPPTSNIDVALGPDASGELAPRGKRFLAAMIDGILMILVLFPMMYLFGFWDNIMKGVQPGIGTTLLMALGGFAIYVLLNGYLLSKYGQTIGKRSQKIKIVSVEGAPVSLPTILLRRQLPIQLMSLIPIVGNFAGLGEVLLIFRADRRCLHDLIAGTKVINA